MVEDLLRCPECGGLIGATAPSDAGVPCTCFAHAPSKGPADTDVVPSPTQYNPAEKRCITCGKDLAGHRRVRDQRGYLCLPCYQKEQRELYGDRVRCGSCGRMTKEAVLQTYEGTRMCPDCFHEREKLKKLQIQRLGIATARTRADMRIVYGLAIAAGVLLLIIVIHWI